MAGTLPQEEGIALIRKLAEDDAFRTLFEKDPRTAMKQLGISDEMLASLDPGCVNPRTLAPKEKFAELLKDVNSEAFLAAVGMQTPEARLR